tara:strand:+ start:3529 stop:3912 length:384 start_codon:yes stop_codon:yes gene_type:complete
MATTFTWKVDSLKTDPNDDNYITEATAKVFGTEGSVTKAATVSCIFPGNKASVGSDFKSLEDLKKEDGESIIIGWIKVGIMDYKVAKIEKTIQNAIDIHNSKVIETTVKAADTSYSAQPTETPTPSE